MKSDFATSADGKIANVRIVSIVQARMGSKRRPGKVMAELAGRPMLEHILRNLLRSRITSRLVLATTKLPEDDVIADLCERMRVHIYRGSENDVLDRYYGVSRAYKADVVARLTADNPLVDGTFLDFCLSEFFSANPAVDYLDTGGTPRFPKGLSVEVMTAKALEDAWRDDHDLATREHVTLFIKAHPERFRLKRLPDTAENLDLWWTVDTEEDLQRARRLYDALQLQKGLPRHIELEKRVRESGIL